MTPEESIVELRAYVDHLREIIDGIGRHTPYPARCWTLDEFRAARAALAGRSSLRAPTEPPEGK